MIPLVTGIVIMLLDQWTKYEIRCAFTLGESVTVIPAFMNLTYLRNTGAAWGMLGGQNSLLTVLSLVMLVVMVLFRRSFLNDTLSHRLALGLMIGGIVGNLADRLRLGWVTDFLDFHVAGYHWPSFNIADAAICVGVGIYILTSWRDVQHHTTENAGATMADTEPHSRNRKCDHGLHG